jgi:ABC-type Mn2+/Zn2+ transport system permease subunit
MIINNTFALIIISALVAAASAYVGSFMVLKRMSLVGDALSHVALPGMAIAITLGISPIIGAFTALTIAIVGIWYMEETSENYPEALVGIFFTASLAIGVLITSETDLLEALFGSIEKMTLAEGIISMVLSVAVIILTKTFIKPLLISVISKELAISTGFNIKKINLLYFLLVGIVVSLGVRFVGTLLMGALVVVPAASAKNISQSFKSYYLISIAIGVASSLLGIIIAKSISFEIGPIVVLTSVFIYFLTYLAKLIKHK